MQIHANEHLAGVEYSLVQHGLRPWNTCTAPARWAHSRLPPTPP
ncbi:hypothetical protein ACIQPT_32815 [Streptomyces sp. NPDC091289]